MNRESLEQIMNEVNRVQVLKREEEDVTYFSEVLDKYRPKSDKELCNTEPQINGDEAMVVYDDKIVLYPTKSDFFDNLTYDREKLIGVKMKSLQNCIKYEVTSADLRNYISSFGKQLPKKDDIKQYVTYLVPVVATLYDIADFSVEHPNYEIKRLNNGLIDMTPTNYHGDSEVVTLVKEFMKRL